jgi:hypothetical protein
MDITAVHCTDLANEEGRMDELDRGCALTVTSKQHPKLLSSKVHGTLVAAFSFAFSPSSFIVFALLLSLSLYSHLYRHPHGPTREDGGSARRIRSLFSQDFNTFSYLPWFYLVNARVCSAEESNHRYKQSKPCHLFRFRHKAMPC